MILYLDVFNIERPFACSLVKGFSNDGIGLRFLISYECSNECIHKTMSDRNQRTD